MQCVELLIPPPADALARLPDVLIADTIERLLAELDGRTGDPDLEEIDEREPDGEEHCPAWVERVDQSRPAYPGVHTAFYAEDDEDDDPDHAQDEGEPDFRRPLAKFANGPGCLVADPDLAVDDSRCDGEDGI